MRGLELGSLSFFYFFIFFYSFLANGWFRHKQNLVPSILWAYMDNWNGGWCEWNVFSLWGFVRCQILILCWNLSSCFCSCSSEFKPDKIHFIYLTPPPAPKDLWTSSDLILQGRSLHAIIRSEKRQDVGLGECLKWL